jgi:hypothetical protein
MAGSKKSKVMKRMGGGMSKSKVMKRGGGMSKSKVKKKGAGGVSGERKGMMMGGKSPVMPVQKPKKPGMKKNQAGQNVMKEGGVVAYQDYVKKMFGGGKS